MCWTYAVLACGLAVVLGCGASATVETRMTRDSEPAEIANKSILDEVNAAGTWFRAKKSVAIWAKLLKVAQTVETLEGPMKAEVGDFLCRGAAGERPMSFWIQIRDTFPSASSLL